MATAELTRKYNPPWLRVVDRLRRHTPLNEVYRRCGWGPGRASSKRSLADLKLKDVYTLARALRVEPWRLAREIIRESRFPAPITLAPPKKKHTGRKRVRDSADARILDAMAGLHEKRSRPRSRAAP